MLLFLHTCCVLEVLNKSNYSCYASENTVDCMCLNIVHGPKLFCEGSLVNQKLYGILSIPSLDNLNFSAVFITA